MVGSLEVEGYLNLVPPCAQVCPVNMPHYHVAQSTVAYPAVPSGETVEQRDTVSRRIFTEQHSRTM